MSLARVLCLDDYRTRPLALTIEERAELIADAVVILRGLDDRELRAAVEAIETPEAPAL